MQVLKEEGRSRESADTVTRNADTSKRTAQFGRKQTEEPEVEVMARHADTAMGRDTTRTHAGSYILKRHHSGTKISQRKMKLR